MATQKDKLLAEAQKLAEKGQHERAVKVYLKLVAEDGNDVRTWLKIGELYTRLNKPGEAAQTYQHVADAYCDQGFYRKAIAVYKQMLKLQPEQVHVHERLADLYRQMGLIPDAIEQFGYVAALHQKDGRSRAALQPLKQIVELDPQNVAMRVKLAELFSREGMAREAIDEFAKAAEFLHEGGRLDDYMKVAERLLFHSPDNRPVSRELARLYLRKGDARRALPRLQVCFKADPRDAETLSLLSEAFQVLGQTGKSVSVLKELARVHAEAHQMAERQATWRRVLALDPKDIDAQRECEGVAWPEHPELDDGLSVTVAEEPMGAAAAVTAARPAPSVRMDADGGARSPPPSSRLYDDDDDEEISFASVENDDVRRIVDASPTLDEQAIRRVLAETEVFAKYNLHARAIEHVRGVFESQPTHEAAREKLVHLLAFVGRNEEAVGELRGLLARATGQPREARYLDELLRIAPDDVAAGARREALGPVAPPPAPSPPPVEPEPLERLEASGTDSLDHVEVDLADEEIYDSVVEVAAVEISDDDVEAADDVAAESEAGVEAEVVADEEFAVVVEDASRAPPVPEEDEEIEDRFGADLDESPDQVTPVAASPADSPAYSSPGLPAHSEEPAGLPAATISGSIPRDVLSFGDVSPAVHGGRSAGEGDDRDFAPGSPPAAAGARDPSAQLPPAPPSNVLEDELEEADFYLAQGMVDEAREILERLARGLPEHPLVQAKLRDLDSSAAAAAGEATIAMSMEELLAKVDLSPDTEGAVRLEPTPSVPAPSSVSAGPRRRSANSVVEHGVTDDDFDSHFDLGVGYREMGLLEQAIGEFKRAAGDPRREVQCRLMIGLCYMQKGMTHEAVRHFKQGLYAENILEDEELSLYYELALAYVGLRDRTEALYYFERIRKRKPRYRDVDRHVEQLGTLSGDHPAAAVPRSK